MPQRVLREVFRVVILVGQVRRIHLVELEFLVDLLGSATRLFFEKKSELSQALLTVGFELFERPAGGLTDIII